MIRLLEWDSRHFGIRVGRVESDRLDDAAALSLAASKGDYDCVYLLADANDSHTAESAARIGFEMVDVRVTLERDLHDSLEIPTPALDAQIRVATDGDLGVLESLAAGSYGSSRFYFDRRFARDRVDELYRIWLRNDFANPAARVFVAGGDGSPIGYVTCTRSASEAEIGLVALSAEARGGGWARALVLHALQWAVAGGAHRLTVVTQARNVKAQRLYERCRFLCHQTAVWYHLWPM